MRQGPHPSHRLPGLDGLRAISIICVLFGHAMGTANVPLKHHHLPSVFQPHIFAGLGVRVFFVISGFLITTLLFSEQERRGTISLRDFYIRRTFRIFPAFYFYLAVVVVLAQLGSLSLLGGDILAAATYTMNYHRPRAWYLGHLWSLSVEEQFYFMWPAVVLLLSKRNVIRVAALAMVVAPMVRVGVFVTMPSLRAGIGETFPSVFDSIAAGCLLAGARETLATNRLYAGVLRSPFFVLVPLVGFSAAAIQKVSVEYAVGQTIQNVTIAMTVDWAVREHQGQIAGMIGRLLEAHPIAWLGRLSYSLYLWQQMFLNRQGTHWFEAFPFNLGAALGMAVVSYYLVEQPLLRFRERHFKSRPVGTVAEAR